MKKAIKLTMLLLFAATLTIVSCSKEYLYESKIVGRWECIYNSGGGGGSGFEWLFRSDGVFITYDSHDLMCGIESSYSIKNNQLNKKFLKNRLLGMSKELLKFFNDF